MPKRKRNRDYDSDYYIRKKIRKLQKKLGDSERHRRRRQHESDDDSSSLLTSRRNSFSESQDVKIIDEERGTDIDEYGEEDDVDPQASTPRLASMVVDISKMVQVGSPPRPPTATTSPNITTLETDTTAPTTLMEVRKETEITTPTTMTEVPASATDTSAPTTTDTGLDKELLEILGIDPTTDKKYGKDIQQDLARRIEHYTTSGLAKEIRKELKEKYLTPGNCKMIDPPELNAEIKAAVTDVVAKRDKAIEGKQKTLTSAITCLGEAITLLLSSKEKDTNLLKLLMEATRLICDCQHTESITRRNFLLNTLKKDMRDQLLNTKIDKFLFSENLSEALKSAKAISKSGADLKQTAPKAPAKKSASNAPNTSKNLNWRNAPARRQPAPARTKEPVMTTTSTRPRPVPSYKTSSHPQHRLNHSRR